jgi:hypothetical protein
VKKITKFFIFLKIRSVSLKKGRSVSVLSLDFSRLRKRGRHLKTLGDTSQKRSVAVKKSKERAEVFTENMSV